MSFKLYDVKAIIPQINENLLKSKGICVADANIIRRDNFTMCCVKGFKEGNQISGFGFSKRNPTDKVNPNVGRKLAFRRAIMDLIEIADGQQNEQS